MKRHLLRWLRPLLALLILAVLVHQIRWTELSGNLRGMQPGWFVGALACVLPNLALQALKWRLLIRRAVPEATLWAATRSFAAGVAVGLVTPGRMGEAVRGFYVGVGDPLRLSGSFFLDKALNVVPLLMVCALVAWPMAGLLAALPWCLATAFCLALAARPGGAQALLRRLGPRPDSRLGRVLSALTEVDAATLLRATWLSIAIYGVVYIQYMMLLRALAPQASWAAAGAAFVAINLAGSIPATPAGVGSREAGAALALSAFGIPAAAAVNSAFLIFVMNLGPPALLGLWVVAGAGRRPPTQTPEPGR